MAHDEVLAQSLRDALSGLLGADLPGIAEKRMMGGVCFMLNGNMVCGADRSKQGERRYMFRVGKDNGAARALPGGEPVVLGARLMPGFFFLDAQQCGEALMKRWLAVALAHAAALPPK